jgi:hypothetical protein
MFLSNRYVTSSYPIQHALIQQFIEQIENENENEQTPHPRDSDELSALPCCP